MRAINASIAFCHKLKSDEAWRVTSNIAEKAETLTDHKSRPVAKADQWHLGQPAEAGLEKTTAADASTAASKTHKVNQLDR